MIKLQKLTHAVHAVHSNSNSKGSGIHICKHVCTHNAFRNACREQKDTKSHECTKCKC